MEQITDFQKRCIEAVRRYPNGHATTGQIASALREPGRRLACLAVNAAMTSLRKKGIVAQAPNGSDQWARPFWFLAENYSKHYPCPEFQGRGNFCKRCGYAHRVSCRS